ncbi:MAG: efflux RND transporter periplasmic adaptor subunit [Woeseiaceae bacterium]
MIKLISRFAGTFQLLFVVAVVGSAILLSVALKPEQTAAYPSAVTQTLPVSVVQPAVSSYRPTVSLNGVVEARTVTDVIPQVSGRVVEVAPEFRAGARVGKGGLLFRIDPSDYQLAVERTLAEIEAARSELALLEAQSTAEKQVWNQQFPDRKIPDLIAKVPQIAAAKARIHSAEAARQVAELSLRRTVVRSPFNARVLNTRLEVGQVINTGSNVGSVFSVDSLEIAVPVSLEQLALIGDAIGQDARITRVGNADLALSGAVVRQAAALNETTRLGTLYVAAEESDALMLGEFVGIQIEGNDTPQALRVPAASLTSRDQVWVVSNGVLETRRIEVLGSDNEITVVRDFDVADGIVAVPPADGRVGLPVTVQMDSGLAAAGAGAGNVAE